MDSEQASFLKSPGRTTVPTGTRRALENVVSLSHPRDCLVYSPSSCGINNVSVTRGIHDIHV